MAFPFEAVFLAFLAAYMVYSEWQGLDSRYPIVAALILLVVAAIMEAAGAAATADTLAVYVFFLLGAGVILLLVDYIRDARREVVPSPNRESPTSEQVPAEPPAPPSS